MKLQKSNNLGAKLLKIWTSETFAVITLKLNKEYLP